VLRYILEQPDNTMHIKNREKIFNFMRGSAVIEFEMKYKGIS